MSLIARGTPARGGRHTKGDGRCPPLGDEGERVPTGRPVGCISFCQVKGRRPTEANAKREVSVCTLCSPSLDEIPDSEVASHTRRSDTLSAGRYGEGCTKGTSDQEHRESKLREGSYSEQYISVAVPCQTSHTRSQTPRRNGLRLQEQKAPPQSQPRVQRYAGGPRNGVHPMGGTGEHLPETLWGPTGEAHFLSRRQVVCPLQAQGGRQEVQPPSWWRHSPGSQSHRGSSPS